MLTRAGLASVAGRHKRIVLKPNLVEAALPPITTPVELTAAVVDFLRSAVPQAEIIIAEGCGSKTYDTDHCFARLGYHELAAAKGVELVDLNRQPTIRLTLPDCRRWPEMHLPALLFESFLVSLPVLKVHTLAKVTLTLKNMMGAAPPCHYQQGGHWKKAAFHHDIQAAVADLNRYRSPDFTLLDATVGLAQSHLGGPPCKPPPGLLAASFDPVALDAYGADLLNLDWREIDHIRELHGELGFAEPLTVVAV
ncbi:DUF362 domain-containing protein [Desulfurivibrio dismutans]|uniref:DUF362 domain-containing protein n=1 Tax=Desulfurivibrio dismutans TaxID=1398908 RepID=UPI0023DC55F7|nr:DUF362 domain-containing protein [Desulfurivibrio alkaliphilus]MDF1614808.1 DUF362 domain-containing protein [Desulfurivibrio alkaliphilus]